MEIIPLREGHSSQMFIFCKIKTYMERLENMASSREKIVVQKSEWK